MLKPKPKIVHLVPNSDEGGVIRGIDTMINSSLNEVFDITYNIGFCPKVYPDIIVWHAAVESKFFPTLFWLKLKFKKAKLIIHEHHYSSNWELYNPPPNLKRFHLMVKACFSLADKIVANSNANALWMINNNLVPSSKISVIESYNQQISSFLSLPPKPLEDTVSFALYGRACPQKGFETFLDALPFVEHNANFYFKLLDNQPSTNLLKEKIANLNDPRLFIEKDISIIDLLQKTDCVIIPSLWESFGMICAESKAAHKAIISSLSDGLIDQMFGNPSPFGLTFSPGNHKELALCINRIITSPHLISQWSKNSREDVQYAYLHYSTSWSLVFHSLLSVSFI